MFVVNKAKLEILQKAFQKLFDTEMGKIGDEAIVRLLAKEVNNSNFILHDFIAERIGAGMKEDTGEPEAGHIRVEEIIQRVKRWYDAFSMNVDDLENDKLDIYRDEVASLAEGYARHRVQLVTQTLEGGFTDPAYDGSTFFGTHQLMSGNGINTNIVTGGLTETSIAEAIRLLGEMKDESGNILGLRGTHLLVPPAMEFTARKILNAALINGGESNILYNRLEVVVNPFATKTDTAYVLDAGSRSRKPVILHVARKPRLMPDTTKVVSREIIEWYLRGRYNTYLGLYQYVVAITP